MTEKTKHERIADITADIRKRADAAEAHGDERVTSGHAFALLLRSIAERIDAAAARLEDHALFVGAYCEATRKAGNAARIRAALEDMVRHDERVTGCDVFQFGGKSCDGKTSAGKCHFKTHCDRVFRAKAALDSPTRNCDMPYCITFMAAKRAFAKVRPLPKYTSGDPAHHEKAKNWFAEFSDWLLVAAEKGGTP